MSKPIHADDEDDDAQEQPGEAESIGFGEQGYQAQAGRIEIDANEWPHRIQVAHTIIAQHIGSDRLRREAEDALTLFLRTSR